MTRGNRRLSLLSQNGTRVTMNPQPPNYTAHVSLHHCVVSRNTACVEVPPPYHPEGTYLTNFIPKLVEYQSLKHFKERKCRGPSNINLKPGVSNQEQTPASNQPHTFFLSPTETLQALPGGRFQVVPFINKLAWYVTLNPRPSAFGCPFLRIYQRGKRMAWAMDCT